MITSSAPVPHQPDLRALRALAWQNATGRLAISGACGSHTGLRPRNEDAFFASARDSLVAIADGMGGHPGGHIASDLAVRHIHGPLTRGLADDHSRGGPTTPEHHQARMMSALVNCNRNIRQRHPQDPARPMATTIVALWLIDDWAVFGHVGDSRLYRLRDGVMLPMTLDHNAIGEALRLGLGPDDVSDLPPHLLSRALGLDDTVRPDVGYCSLVSGDRYLLCTDGLYEELDDISIAETLARAVSAEQTMRELMEDAILAGSGDNITLSVIDVR